MIRSLQVELEATIGEQRDAMARNWRERLSEISSARRDLDALFKSMSSNPPDSALLMSYRNATENVEEQNNNGERRDDACRRTVENRSSPTPRSTGDVLMKLIPGDSPQQLMCLKKEELISYFKMEMNRMKRQHELALQEKTEELFSLKRDLLKEKGSSPLHFSKERDLEIAKKKVSEIILKLDDIVLKSKEPPVGFDCQDASQRLKERADALFSESPWLRTPPVDEKKEAQRTAPQGSAESKLVEEVERLRFAIEEVRTEASIKEEKYKRVLENLVDEIESNEQVLETATKIIEDIYCLVYEGAIANAVSSTNSMLVGSYKEKDSINAELSEKEEGLRLEIEENGRLKQQVAALSTSVRGKEMLASEATSQLVKQKEQFELVRHELNLYKDRDSKQQMIIANLKDEINLSMGKMDEACQQIHQKEAEICNLNQKLMISFDGLKETERQNSILQNDICDKQGELASKTALEKELKEQLEAIVASVAHLSRTTWEYGCKVIQKIETNEARLNLLSHQCSQIKQQSKLLKKKALWYKERFEAKCEDLQKAENEVDLLGDEVDTLLGLLEKIYFALDHYSSVLQYYPGVVEILKLIRRELDGETTKSK
ncbi:uncharacterized protein A4U43_C06F190 [Asparagus officinalis]|uniref:Uncharacterized protein n=1 Tax=Asparagus officinalis TaxID=4686 RepID=A0A5P1EID5_ASPOF|nr:WPP domain-associated protein-like [Asparagus officinalis]XP_020269205.1 WPP domain-associated protein-like [Asparagus officinalis]XP_020269206.1 WPP domain-associated protein-like [Asparagus officinalis]XP_020269207.1 WPP domain-associated protein-like [Asparagus officinalis]ONK65715.1 uncharacterized protein A4U43_C06F190 [Asparagus officinalis]